MTIGKMTFSSTNSSQQLMNPDAESVQASASALSVDGEHSSSNTDDDKRPNSRNSHQYDGLSSITYSEWFAVVVLCFVNLINYMDRFTIAGVLGKFKDEFVLDDSQAGLIQTAFVISYMIFAPLFGYLGDRYSRRWIMIAGVALWSLTTLIGSFMPDYGSFIFFRAMVGIGEASYSTIAPTIISDYFIDEIRSKMLAMFYFAIPVGSGCGYIVGSAMDNAFGSWRWALRVTPVLGLIAVILIFFTKEPERGQHESSHHLQTSSYKEDLKDLSKNPSFMLSTLGFTCVAFVTGALAWWGPEFMSAGLALQPGNSVIDKEAVSYKFGIVAMASGLIGVPLGSYLAQRFRQNSHKCDPLICAWGLFISAPMVFIALILARSTLYWCFFFVFLAEVTLNLCWSIVADILLYVVLPTRRSTAEAFQILISHAFGDAGSPYLIGLISEAVKRALGYVAGHTKDDPSDLEKKFKSLQYALFLTTVVEVLGGIFFLLTSMYIIRDKSKVEQSISASQINDATPSQPTPQEQSTSSNNNPDYQDDDDFTRD